jgi:hypothetical protein
MQASALYYFARAAIAKYHRVAKTMEILLSPEE